MQCHKFPTIVVLLSVSPFKSVNICFILFRFSCTGYIYINEYNIFLYWSIYRYIMPFFVFCYRLCFKVDFSDMSIAILPFLSFPFAWNIFFYSLTSNLCVSLALRWVSCIAYIWVSLFYPVSYSVSFFFFFYWRIVDLQCSISFCCTAKWISYI